MQQHLLKVWIMLLNWLKEMTQKEKNTINQVIKDIKSECATLEELFIQTRSINLRWVKQALEENAVNQLKELIK
jgi:predicted DNA-binding ribbon-helix-helix protein